MKVKNGLCARAIEIMNNPSSTKQQVVWAFSHIMTCDKPFCHNGAEKLLQIVRRHCEYNVASR